MTSCENFFFCVYLTSIYTAGQLLKTDDTITHSNPKMKESKMRKIRISAGFSKKRCAYANCLYHVSSSRDSTDNRFKRFDACGVFFLHVKVLQEYLPTNNTIIRALTEELDKLAQQMLDSVVQSMTGRVRCCIALLSGHIPY
ncbi:hypothetical protein AVEN_174042-1 [Araneus ventricosus]|uniref:Uncharacterized protein n=1 Tax=Araneus ventricosus TaxID=182803 RepID=A0A4Y2C179_ARAVE|nr:hypothetical protein AVEN_174042-1 [Araneus ventricosus]